MAKVKQKVTVRRKKTSNKGMKTCPKCGGTGKIKVRKD